MCEWERPSIEPGTAIAFTRTTPGTPPVYSPEDWARITEGRTLHESGPISNVCADWGMAISTGLLARRETALGSRRRAAANNDEKTMDFLDAAVESIDAVCDLARRYATAARTAQRADLAAILDRVPALPPRSFHEALQSLRLLHAAVWLSGNYHVCLGRLDQYLWPWLNDDLASGRLDIPAAEDLLAEFFISLNRDSDLYPGVQQGDNGQSLVIGGLRRDGGSAVNTLTWMVLRVARDVAMIDPKINLRVDGGTDPALLTLAAELTRKGLGFPQYSNDDVVVPALVANGYALEDARDYAVAACWEFLIPGRGMEVVNIGAVSMPAAADRAIREGLSAGEGMESILERAGADMRRQVDEIVARYRTLLLPPAPYYSVLMDGCLENGRDLSEGLLYNGFGIHGACSASAAEALAAVEKLVIQDRSVAPAELIGALDAGFSGAEALRLRLLNETPRVGNDDDRVDSLLARIFELFADACVAAGDNGRGGRIRAGTGSAMYYVWLAQGHEGMHEPVVGATADGRRVGDLFGANLAPSPGVVVRGPFSVLRSFSKLNYRRLCNGGPVTLELQEGVFRGADALGKVAMLVQAFVRSGCQQLQLNCIDVETLRDAKSHPEKYPNLIVRVWGWSGYFCELEEVYQDHVIARHSFDIP